MSNKIIYPKLYPVIMDVFAQEENLKHLPQPKLFDATELVHAISAPGKMVRRGEDLLDPFINGEFSGKTYAPPFDVFFAETRMGIALDLSEADEEGVAVLMNIADNNRIAEIDMLNGKADMLLGALCIVEHTKEHENFRWHLTIVTLVSMLTSVGMSRPKVMGATGLGSIHYDGSIAGILLDDRDTDEISMMNSGITSTETFLALGGIRMILVTLMLLNDRTEVEIASPNRTTRKLMQRAAGSGYRSTPKQQEVHVVHIHPDSKEYPRPLRSGEGGKKAKHGVRGHFRRVGKEGVFGKGYKAGELMWISPHVRGDASLGKINQQYKVHKKKEE